MRRTRKFFSVMCHHFCSIFDKVQENRPLVALLLRLIYLIMYEVVNKCHVDSRWKTWHTGHGNGLFRVQLEEIETVERQLHPLSPAVYLNRLDSFEWLLYRVVDRKHERWRLGVAANKNRHYTLTYYVSCGGWLKFKVKDPEKLCFVSESP